MARMTPNHDADCCCEKCVCEKAESEQYIEGVVAAAAKKLNEAKPSPPVGLPTEAPWLEPCPFCGASNARTYIPSYGGHVVFCGTCNAEGPMGDIASQAVAAWNRRSVSAPSTPVASEGQFPQTATVSVPRALVERAMESCEVNNDHYAWKELLRCLDPAGAPK